MKEWKSTEEGKKYMKETAALAKRPARCCTDGTDEMILDPAVDGGTPH
jgi:hypothetical protein